MVLQMGREFLQESFSSNHTLLAWIVWIGKFTHAQTAETIAILQGLLHLHQIHSQSDTL